MDVISRCYRCKKDENVKKMYINNDGITITFECGYIMKKIFDM